MQRPTHAATVSLLGPVPALRGVRHALPFAVLPILVLMTAVAFYDHWLLLFSPKLSTHKTDEALYVNILVREVQSVICRVASIFTRNTRFFHVSWDGVESVIERCISNAC
jgi:hypothetical protein